MARCLSRNVLPSPRWSPSTTFSATVNVSTRRKCWCTMKIRASSASRGEWNCIGLPSRRISPASGRYRPVRMFESVLLPAPFSPSSECTSPAAASKSTLSFASTPGKRFVIPRIETAEDGGAPFAPLRSINSAFASLNLLARRAPDHALHEPVHAVEAVRAPGEHVHLLPLGHAQLALLVVERAGELVERAVLDLLHLRRDRGLGRGADVRPV